MYFHKEWNIGEVVKELHNALILMVESVHDKLHVFLC